MSKQYFPGDKKCTDKLMKELFIDKIALTQNKAPSRPEEVCRAPTFDDMNRKILNDNMIKPILDYELDLQQLFIIYMAENQQKRELVR